MNIDEINLVHQLFPKYRKVDREFLILCLKHDFNNLFIENIAGKVIFDFKQHWMKNLQILTHDDIWFKDLVKLNYFKKFTSLKYVFRSNDLSYHVYVEYFQITDDEYHVKIKKTNMPCFNDLNDNSYLKKAISRMKFKNKLELSLHEKPLEFLQKI